MAGGHIMSLVETIAAAVEPWNRLYSHTKPLSEAVTFAHVGSLLVGGGLAIASDRATLRVRGADVDQRRRYLREFSTVHRHVVAALALMTVSGLGMALADVETFFVAPIFWVKMAAITMLLANGFNITRTERALAANPAPSNRLWRRMTTGAVTSIALWLTTTLLGVVLMDA